MVNRTGQGVRVPQLNRQAQPSALTPQVQYSTVSQAAGNAGDAMSGLSDVFRSIGNRMENRLDVIAQDEAQEQGVVDAMAGSTALRRDGTVRGQAYDAAAARTMLAKNDTALRVGAEEIYQKFKDSPAALEKHLNAQKDGILGSDLPQIVKAELELGFDRISAGYMSDANRRAEAWQMDADRAEAMTAMDARRKTIERLSFRAENDDMAADALTKEIDSLRDFALAYGPKGAFELNGVQYPADMRRAGIYGVADVQKMVTDTENMAKEGRVLGKFMNMKDLASKQKFLNAFEQEFWTEKGGVEFDLEQYDRMTSRMRADVNRLEANQRGFVSLLNKEITASQSMIEKGYSPGEDVLTDMETRAYMSGDAEAVAGVGQVRALSDFQNEARALRPDELQSWINAEMVRVNADPQRGTTPFEADRLDLAQKLLGNMNTELSRDPLSWGARVGVTSGVALNIADPASVQQRIKDAHTVAAHYGTTMQLMTDEEVAQWTNAWNVGSADDRAGMMVALAANFGDDAVYAFQDLSKVSPAIANMGALMVNSPEHQKTGRDFAIGDAALAAGQKVLPSSTKLNAARRETLGAAYGYVPTAGQAVVDTADRIYAARALRKGLGPDELDEGLYNRALQEASGAWFDRDGVQHGGIAVQKKGHRIVLPPNVTDAQFDDLIKGLSDEDLIRASVGGGAPVGENGMVYGIKDFKRFYLISSGPGRYTVSTVNPSKSQNPFYLQGTNPDGLYEIDLMTLIGGGE